MTFASYITNFFNKNINQGIAPHPKWGYQCVGVPKELTNGLARRGIPDISNWRTMTGGAEGIWNQTHPTLVKYFDKIPVSRRPFKKGDIVVFDGFGKRGASSTLGHVALVVSDDTQHLKVFEQPGGMGYHKSKCRYTSYLKNNIWEQHILGSLRPKPTTLAKLNLLASDAVSVVAPAPRAPTRHTELITPIKKQLRLQTDLWDLRFENFEDADSLAIHKKGYPFTTNRVTVLDELGARYYVPDGAPPTRGFNVVDCEDYVPTIEKITSSHVTPAALFLTGGMIASQFGVDIQTIIEAVAGLYSSGHLVTTATQIIKQYVPAKICQERPRWVAAAVAFGVSWVAVEALPVASEITAHPNLKHAAAAAIALVLASINYDSIVKRFIKDDRSLP